jgi:hypothetical protein
MTLLFKPLSEAWRGETLFPDIVDQSIHGMKT